MQTYLEERIGVPELFTGRKKELKDLLHWAENIKRKLSKSTAILSRRKTGKSALLERLFNIIFAQNNGLIPFYYQVDEHPQWIVDFAKDFFLSFIFQYIAFYTRKKEYLSLSLGRDFEKASQIAKKENFDFLVEHIENFKRIAPEDGIGAWNFARNFPLMIATLRNEYILQIIDEFQYMGKYIYRDKEITRPFTEMAGTYYRTAEYKNAPLLISGSWIGWLLQDLGNYLHGRFIRETLDNMPENEAIEMIFKYSLYLEIPVDSEIAEWMFYITEGNPSYISALFYSRCPDKDFNTEQGLLKTLEFELTHQKGLIKSTWMEYIGYAFAEINGDNPQLARSILLYLCKNKHRQVSKKELIEQLQLKISDADLEKRLEALFYNDIIERGTSNFYYQGIKDHIFEKLFRAEYADEIDNFDPPVIINEYRELYEKLNKEHKSLKGTHANLKGRYAEYDVIDNLRFRAYKKNDLFCSLMQNIPADFRFADYKSVWKYTDSVESKRSFEIDVFARADDDEYSLIGEVKNRIIKFDLSDAKEFLDKANNLIEKENIQKAVIFVLSISGFGKGVPEFFEENKMAWSEDEKWIKK